MTTPKKPAGRDNAGPKVETAVSIDTTENAAPSIQPNDELLEAKSMPNNPDPFDPANMRLDQDFAKNLGVKKALLTVPLRKPAREWWVRVHPEADYRTDTFVVELKEERETYLVQKPLWTDLAGESTFCAKKLVTAVNRQGTTFVWPIRLPGPDGKLDDWNASALEAVELATKGWVRVTANMSLGAYDVWQAETVWAEPAWPDKTFRDLLAIAFKGRVIDNMDHPVIKSLRGQA